MLCSKSKEVDCYLKELFRERQISKRYLAVVSGRVDPPTGELSYPLDDKPCLSRYRVRQYSRSASYGEGWLTTVELYPVTGRTHQLRRHMKLFGHPIIGDERYTTLPLPLSLAVCPYASGQGLNELFLWAVELRFPHPFLMEEVTKRMDGKRENNEDKGTGRRRENKDQEITDDNWTPAHNSSSLLDATDEIININGDNATKNNVMLHQEKEEDCRQHAAVHVEIPEPEIFQQLRDLEKERWEQLEQRRDGSNSCAGKESSSEKDIQSTLLLSSSFLSSCEIATPTTVDGGDDDSGCDINIEKNKDDDDII